MKRVTLCFSDAGKRASRQFAVSGFNAWRLPLESSHTSPENLPGMGESPVPLWAVTVPLAVNSEAPVPYFATHFFVSFFEDVTLAVPTVVVLPLLHVIVPPVANDAAANGCELPPVLPPLQPLIVMFPVTGPVIVVHFVVTPEAPAGALNATVAIELGRANAASTSSTRRILAPSVVG